MLVLGIETSCDETSAAVVEDGRKILSNVVLSQEKLHKPYQGIVPEIASRAHLENINWIIQKALRMANCRLQIAKSKIKNLKSKIKKVDAIAVTVGPGLIGSLLVGKMTAEALGWIWNLPVVGVNHLDAHLFANLLEGGINSPLRMPPFLGLIVSGGHTDLVLVKRFGSYRVLGRTRDDAVGECFDKVAKILGLSYPGGPEIEKLAKKGNSHAVRFARPYLAGSWDFSFSGLKTAVLYYVRKSVPSPQSIVHSKQHTGIHKNDKMHSQSLHHGLLTMDNGLVCDICASFQRAVVDVLVTKTICAAKKFGLKKIVVGGGVAANSELRERFIAEQRKNRLRVFLPAKQNCTDNAAMVACAGYYKLQQVARSKKQGVKNFSLLASGSSLRVDPSLSIQNW